MNVVLLRVLWKFKERNLYRGLGILEMSVIQKSFKEHSSGLAQVFWTFAFCRQAHTHAATHKHTHTCR